MEELTFTPIYGWGWHNAKGAVDVPERFTLSVRAIERAADLAVPSLIIGQIEGVDHQYAGMWVYLTLRTSRQLPTYNVWIFPEEPTSGSVNPSTAAITGFAELH